ERYVEFNVEAFKELAAHGIEPGHGKVTNITKFAEGGFNRVFLLTMEDGFQAIAKTRVVAAERCPCAKTLQLLCIGRQPSRAPLAVRLALAGHGVLVIEAGGDNGDDVVHKVPGLHLQSTEHGATRWDFYVNHYPTLEDQKLDSKMSWRTSNGDIYVGSNPPDDAEPLGVLYPRAGTLGGCAAHNAMVNIYPHNRDWENLVDVTRDDSWSPKNMRKYFKRLEKCLYVPNDIIGHGFNGWLETRVTDLTLVLEDAKLLSIIAAGATAMGKGIGKAITTLSGLTKLLIADLNSDLPSRDNAEGLYQIPLAVDKDFMRTTPRTFLLDTAKAANKDGSPKYKLDILLNTLVTKVRFDDSLSIPRAVGVEFIHGESLYGADPRASKDKSGVEGKANAKEEVIIAGGSFNSPQILMLNGIGPKKELEKFDIPVVVDSPGVGSNLQDHYEVAVTANASSNFALTEDCTFLRTQDDACLARWKHAPIFKGPYGSNGISISIRKRSSVVDGPTDLILTGAPANFHGYYDGYSSDATADPHHWTWIIEKLHPRNTAGTVTLRSNDPRDTPLINFNYFDSGDTENGAAAKDLQAMYEAVEFARSIYKNVVPLDGSFEEILPGPDVTTEEAVKDFIKAESWGHHASCTCPIGSDDDPNAVLDGKFRVRGVEGLRVVDASVFPMIPGSYTALSTFIISEKAADVILGKE
ncbi:hypothetical protein AJ80_04529, partial [Polytolypa hystricis UAMH7299]